MDLNINRFDIVWIQENLVIGQTPMNTLNVNEGVWVGDYGDVFDRPFINVSEDILADTVNTSASVQPVIVVVEDIIFISEYADTTSNREVNVVDIVTTSEVVALTDGIRFISFVEPVITITEFAGATIAFIVGVEDDLFLDENVFIKVGHGMNITDIVSVSEFVNLGFEIIDLNITQNVSIVESPILGRNPEVLSSVQNVTVLDTAFCQTAPDLSFNDFLRSYPFVEETITNVIAEQFENGSEQRRDKWGRARKRFKVKFSPRLKVEIDHIRSFYESKRGSANYFDFLNPLDNVDYTVKFESNSLVISRDAFNVYSAEATIVEVFI